MILQMVINVVNYLILLIMIIINNKGSGMEIGNKMKGEETGSWVQSIRPPLGIVVFEFNAEISHYYSGALTLTNDI